MKIATGILGWNGVERRTDRYGSICCTSRDFDESALVEPTVSPEMRLLEGKKVKLWAVVTATRKSGHLGDLALGIFPSTPEVGEVIDLGVGILKIGTCAWEISAPEFTLVPGDGRDRFWMDPRALYRVNDQMVELHAEETEEDFSPAPNLQVSEEACIGTGEDDGSFQVKGRLPKKILPTVEKLGGGMFIFHAPSNEKGRKMEATYEEEERKRLTKRE